VGHVLRHSAQGGLIVERRVTWQGKQAGKKMGVKKMTSGIQFFPPIFLPAKKTRQNLARYSEPQRPGTACGGCV
jgi:hypothetical protein